MKHIRRFCLLLSVLAMFVGGFSTTAHAESLDNSAFSYQLAFASNSGANLPFISSLWAPVLSNGLHSIMSDEVTGYFTSDVFISSVVNLKKTDGTFIVKKGEKFNFSISNLFFSFTLGSNGVHCQKFDRMIVEVIYEDDTSTKITPEYVYNSSTFTSSFTGTGIANKNVRALKLDLLYYPTNRMGWSGAVTYLYHMGGQPGIDIDIQSEEAGLLESIGDKLTGGFADLGNKITNVFNSIVELPQKLWEKISDGLKSLFVPSEESMVVYKDKWDELLASRFGAVYQVIHIITDSWDGIMQADETDTIAFPQATINFSGTPFTFGGYDVKIVPDGFGVLVTAIKSIVAIVCTVAFINGLRKRYDEIMGVEQ